MIPFGPSYNHYGILMVVKNKENNHNPHTSIVDVRVGDKGDDTNLTRWKG